MWGGFWPQQCRAGNPGWKSSRPDRPTEGTRPMENLASCQPCSAVPRRRSCSLLLIALIAIVGVAAEPQTAPRQSRLNSDVSKDARDQHAASTVGLTLPERSGIRRKSVPANEESNNLSSSKLPLGLWQLQGRQIDLHAEAIKFRRLRLGASQTEISSNAWVRAAEQRRRMPFDPRPWSKSHRQMSGSTGTTASAGLTQPQVAGIQPSPWAWLGPRGIGGRTAPLPAPSTLAR